MTRRRPVHPIITQLRAAREAQGMSRPYVAALTGLSVHAIEGWEWGERSPVLENLLAYAAVVGLELTLAPAVVLEVAS